MPFTFEEIQDLAVSVIAVSLAIAIAQVGITKFLRLQVYQSLSLMALIFFTVGLGFVLHELAHKFTAQSFGARSFYRAWPAGIFFMLLFPLLGMRFVFAAPGATYIFAYRFSRRQNGLTSLAGPVTNLALAVAFLALGFAAAGFGALAFDGLADLVFYGYNVNLWLGFFNMLPIYPLDGSKVLAWDWRVWAGFTLLLGVFLFLL